MSEAAQLGPRGEVFTRALDIGEGRARLLLVLFFLACALPGFFTLPVVDRDEARFVQATRQMVESGDYVAPRLGEEMRFKKPIGIYWLQSAAVKLSGFHDKAPIWVYRLPSLLAGILAVLLTHAVGIRLFGARAALWAAGLLAASVVLGAEARLAKTDATQLACAVAGQLALARICFTRPGERLHLGWPLLFWAAIGLAILVKGPIVPMLAAFTAVGFSLWNRQWGWLARLRPMIGVPVLVAIVLPWLVAIWLHSGTAFFQEAVGHDLLGKVATGQESHGAPPGAHLAAFLVIFWPGAALAICALPWVWANRAEPKVRFCLAWIVPFWIVFELTATKLPHYTLPTYPAIASLAGAALASGKLDPPAGWMRALVLLAAIGGLLSGIGLAASFLYFGVSVPVEAAALAAIATAIGVAAGCSVLLSGIAAAYRLLFAQAVVLYALGFGVVAPRLEALWITPRLAEAITKASPCADPQVMVSGFSEASLLFTIGTGTRTGDGTAAADFLAGPGCRIVAVDTRQRARFDARNAELGRSASALATVDGFNLGTGRLLSLEILAASPGAGMKGP